MADRKTEGERIAEGVTKDSAQGDRVAQRIREAVATSREYVDTKGRMAGMGDVKSAWSAVSNELGGRFPGEAAKAFEAIRKAVRDGNDDPGAANWMVEAAGRTFIVGGLAERLGDLSLDSKRVADDSSGGLSGEIANGAEDENG